MSSQPTDMHGSDADPRRESRPTCDRCGGDTFEEYGEWVCRRCDAVVGPVVSETVPPERLDLYERLTRAIKACEALAEDSRANDGGRAEVARLRGKAEGLRLARDYFTEAVTAHFASRDGEP